jgi:cell division ATPase FtsA
VTTRLQRVEELLRTHDIEAPSGIGSPEDEYSSEAKMMAERIGTAQFVAETRTLSVKEFKEITRNVWSEMFDLSEEDLRKRDDRFEEIAKRLGI